jgi:hypothetical protein
MQSDHQPDINVGKLLTIGLVSAILLVEIIVGVEALLHRSLQEELQRKVISQPSWELTDLLVKQEEELNAYRWVDRKKRIVAVPIDEAIDMFVKQADPAKLPNTGG